MGDYWQARSDEISAQAGTRWRVNVATPSAAIVSDHIVIVLFCSVFVAGCSAIAQWVQSFAVGAIVGMLVICIQFAAIVGDIFQEWHDRDLARVCSRAAFERQPAPQKPAPVLHVWSDAPVAATPVVPSDAPSFEFLVWCFEHQSASGGRMPTERAARAQFPGEKTNEWLAALSRDGFTVGRTGADGGNRPGAWNTEREFDDALVLYGYARREEQCENS